MGTLIRATVCAFLLGGTGLMIGAENLLKNADFADVGADGVPGEWTFSTGVPDTAPSLRIERADGVRAAVFSMHSSGGSVGWLSQTVDLDDSVKAVRFRARVSCRGDARVRDHSLIRLYWDAVPRAHRGWPPWLYRHFPDGRPDGEGGMSIDCRFAVPNVVNRVRIDLMARWAPGGEIVFSDVHLATCAPPVARRVVLGVVQGHAPGGSTLKEACSWATERIEEASAKGADLVCLGEAINYAGVKTDALSSAEAIPGGPMYRALSEAARKCGIHVVAGLYERDGVLLYNSAVLLGSDGGLIGRYRKVHLPCGEVDLGFTPGDEFPVFETALGRVGLQICYDHHFVEGARILALRGAQIVCLPIWGDGRSDQTAWPLSVRARAMDNGLVYVAANYTEKRSVVVDRNGLVCADAQGRKGVYTAELDMTPGGVDVCIREGRLMPRSFKDVFVRERLPRAYPVDE